MTNGVIYVYFLFANKTLRMALAAKPYSCNNLRIVDVISLR